MCCVDRLKPQPGADIPLVRSGAFARDQRYNRETKLAELMLLRRISENLGSQNWTGVGVDLAIVVLGIFLGLQASQWYEHRQEIGLENSILHRLSGDFEEIAAMAKSAIQFHQEQIVALEQMQRSLRSGKLDQVAKIQFRTGLSDAMGYDLGPSRSGTYAEILSSGHFRLLRSQELRKALSEYDDSVQKADYLFSVFQQGQRNYETVFNRHFTRGPSRSLKVDTMPNGVMYMHGEVIDFNFESMKNDSEFTDAIGRLLEYHINYQFWHSNISRSSNRVLEILESVE